MELLDTVAQFTNVLGIVGGAFAYAFLRPLNTSIDGLKSSIDRLTHKLDRIEERQRQMEKKMVEVEQRALGAHHRITELKEAITR